MQDTQFQGLTAFCNTFYLYHLFLGNVIQFHVFVNTNSLNNLINHLCNFPIVPNSQQWTNSSIQTSSVKCNFL